MSLNKLIKMARKSTHTRFHHGTLVIRGGAIIASGYNHDGRHSEIVALEKLWPSKRKGCSIINIRLTKRGFSNSRPCAHCNEYLRSNGISKVTYSDSLGRFKEERL